jgi:hypothetical protein
MAAAVSLAPISGSVASFSPVAGLKTSKVSAPLPPIQLPFT